MRTTSILYALGALIFTELVDASASVFLRPSTTTYGQLSASEADVLLAHHLGVEPAGDSDFNKLESLLEKAGGQVALGKALLKASDDSLLVVVDVNEADIQQVVPSGWNVPTFTSPLSGSALSSFSSSYLNTAVRTKFSTYTSPQADTFTPPAHRMLDFFDFAADSPAAEAFVREFDSLEEFLEAPTSSHKQRRFGSFHFSSLPALQSQYGHSSEAFQSVLLAVKAALSSPALQDINLALVLNPKSQKTVNFDVRAAESTQAPLPAPPKNAPIFSNSKCFTSAAACQKGTTECSGRGQCVPVKKGPKECFVCQCAVTLDVKNRTEHWSGVACETKDVSTVFTLVGGTSIAIVLVIIFSISLLYSVGREELPNVLNGAVVHAKHD
ncbi:hypothetical protein FRB91_006030 [Serendipita sp. 411]|nr:hypothetical protein FRB91_006030 [Serendipita sp. 411]